MSAIYILDQNDPRYRAMPFGKVTVAYGGCGPIAIHNALVTLGQPLPLEEILLWFLEKPRRTFLHGRLGILPLQLKAFLRSRGFRVITARSARRMEQLAQEADACILHYYFPQKIKGIPLPAAHYAEFSREQEGWLARNTGARGGLTRFACPAAFGRAGKRFFPLVIAIIRP